MWQNFPKFIMILFIRLFLIQIKPGTLFTLFVFLRNMPLICIVIDVRLLNLNSKQKTSGKGE